MLTVPPPPMLAGLSRDELRDSLWRSAGGREPIRPWPGPVADVYYGWLALGRDMNGVTLYGERDAWLAANGWRDAGEREAGHYFFATLEGEMAEIQNILYPRPAEKN